MHLDIKYSVWDRIEIPKDQEEKIEKTLKDNPNVTPGEIYSILGDVETKTLYETAEFLTPYENLDNSTMEIVEGDEIIIDNKNNEKL